MQLYLKSKRFYVISSLLLENQGKAALLIVLTYGDMTMIPSKNAEKSE